MSYSEADQVAKLIEKASDIVIVQADNPDADSLGSALALENILGGMGKTPHLYCGVEMPSYLRYLQGWDRVQAEIPNKFDASIIVDASALTLLEKLAQSGRQGWLASKPCAVLDHHESVDNVIPFANVLINDSARASAGELIYLLAKQLKWPLSLSAQQYVMSSILGDTQGLTNQLASAETYRVMAELVSAGVNRPALEESRREYSKMEPTIYGYKARLMQRTEFVADGQIATVTIPQDEINQYSPLYNPGPLVQGDMLQTVGVRVAIVFKRYDDGKITAAIRSASNAPVAADLAEQFGGGGHAFASGFKVIDGRDFESLKQNCLAGCTALLKEVAT